MPLNYKFLIYSVCVFLGSFFIFFGLIHIALKKYTLHAETLNVPSLVGLNISEAEDTLNKYDLNFMIIDSAAYNPIYERGSILSHFPKAGSVVKPDRKIYLTINPLTIHYVPLPDLKNKSLRQSIRLLENNAFRFGELYYVDHFAKDVVLFSKLNDTIVNKDALLPKFSIVDLYLGNGHHESVYVPSVLGLELAEVKSKLNNNSLNLGVCKKVYVDVDSLIGRVYKQEPEVHQQVSLGQSISIWVGDTINNL